MARGITQPVLLVLLTASQAWACQLSLAYNSEAAPPYLLGDEGMQAGKPGAGVELLQLAAAQVGCSLKLSRVPNMRVLAETRAGKHDGAFMYSYSAERATGFAYPMHAGKPDSSRRITSLTYYLYRMKGAPVSWDGQRFSGLHGAIGVNFGWSIGKDLRTAGIAVEEAINTKQNLEKLRNGRIAAYATQEMPGDAAIQRYGFTGIERLPTPLSTKDYFLVFNLPYYQRNHQRVEALWAAIASLRETMLPKLLEYETD